MEKNGTSVTDINMASYTSGARSTLPAYCKTPFRRFLEKLADPKDVKAMIEGKQTGRIGNLWDAYSGKLDESVKADAIRYAEQQYVVNNSDREQWQKALETKMNDRGLYVIEYDHKANKWVQKGRFKPDWTEDYLYSVNFSPITVDGTSDTRTAIIRHDGKTIRVAMPKGLNDTYEDEIDKNMQAAAVAQAVLVSRKDSDGKPLTDERKAYWQDIYNRAISNGNMYVSQLVSTNKTKAQEYDTYGQ